MPMFESCDAADIEVSRAMSAELGVGNRDFAIFFDMLFGSGWETTRNINIRRIRENLHEVQKSGKKISDMRLNIGSMTNFFPRASAWMRAKSRASLP